MKDVVAVIVDECHQTKATVLSKHLSTTFKDVPIRWGLTGTIPLEDYEFMHLLCCIGPVVGSVKAKALQEIGVLSNLHINIVQVNDYHTAFTNYQAELKYLVSDQKRIEFVSSIMKEIAGTGNTLILVDRVTTGEMLEKLIPNSVFVHGVTDSKSRKKEYKELSFMDDKTIIATFGVCSTGIDVPRVFNVILFEAGKSFIRVIQSIGRGLRVAKDKDFVNIYDVTSTAKYAKRHLAKRKKFYEASSYPFSVTKVDMPT
jgi:superfamily II DNA or RNA helicase